MGKTVAIPIFTAFGRIVRSVRIVDGGRHSELEGVIGLRIGRYAEHPDCDVVIAPYGELTAAVSGHENAPRWREDGTWLTQPAGKD